MAKTYTQLTGAFVSVPAAFEGADSDITDVIKVPIEFEHTRSDLEHTYISGGASNSALLFDLRELPSRFDAKKALRDCDLMRDIIANNPADIEEIVKSVRAVALGEGDREHVGTLLRRLGLSERAFADQGGGFIWILIFLVVTSAGCAHLKPYVKPDPKPH